MSWVTSSRKRVASAASQSDSAAVGTVSQASSANGARSPSRTTAGIEVSKTTSPKSSATSTACSLVIVSGGVAVSPSTLASGSCSSSSPSSRPQTSSRWWHSSSTSTIGPASRSVATSARPLSCSRAISADSAAPSSLDLVVGIEDRDGLVGQRGQRLGQVSLRAGRQPHQRGLVDPLALDRGVGPEDDRLVGAVPEQPAHGLQADQGLARSRRQLHPGAGAARRPGPVQRLERQRLVAPQPHPQKIRSTTACARRVVRR